MACFRFLLKKGQNCYILFLLTIVVLFTSCKQGDMEQKVVMADVQEHAKVIENK